MWMLGCVLYEILTFKKPFQGESLNVILLKEGYNSKDIKRGTR